MLLQLIGKSTQIAEAIDAFPAKYHSDYANVRSIGRRYAMEQPPRWSTALQLTKELRQVLFNWGAGKRKAAPLRTEDDFVSTLLETTVQSSLAELASISLADLGIGRNFRLLNGECDQAKLARFDKLLVSTLQNLSKKLFNGNTNVTYPLKTVLLISGFMPAFDGNVRAGLSNGGFPGVKSTRFPIPSDTRCADGKKLTRLPFILGQCWTRFSCQFQQAVQKSSHSTLLDDPGRVFDVLLFMQADNPPTLRLDCNFERWYELV